MNKVIGLLVLVCALGASRASADDIEIYFTVGAESDAYVALFLDASPNLFTGLYTGPRGLSEAEAAMTPASYAQLLAFREGDDSCGNDVGRWEVYRAVLATALLAKKNATGPDDIFVVGEDDPNDLTYGDINLALLASNFKAEGGGNILQGYERLADGFENILADIGAIPCALDGGSDHEQQIIDTYLEWYSYLNGLPVQLGMNTSENFNGLDPVIPDYDPNTITGVTDNDYHGTARAPDEDESYESPFESGECPQLYTITATMTGTAGGQDGKLASGAYEVTTDFPPEVFADPLQPERVIQHMRNTDLLPALAAYAPLAKGWVVTDKLGDRDRANVGEIARGGGTTSLDVSDPEQLLIDFGNLLGEVLSVSSTFVAASVPVNVFNQTRALDNLFVALFEAESTVAWPGNIKKLKLVDSDDTDADTDFDSVIDATTPEPNPGFETGGPNKGRIYASALTFWTDKTLLTDSNGNDADDPEFIPVNADGRVVDRGGAGQKIPGVIQTASAIIGDSNADNSGNARQVFVESAAGTLVDFSTSLQSDTAIQDLLGAVGSNAAQTRADAEDLIKWGRGQDVDNNTSNARFWVLADAIHSRPFALNYGDTDGDTGGYNEDNPDVVLFFGTGDGMFHAVENTSSATSNNETGKEIFGFYPREMLKQIKARRNPAIMNDGRDMRYGVDGEPIVFTVDGDDDGNLRKLKLDGTDSGDEAYVYFGLRRGGFSYYALDVIDPDNPKLQWVISQTRTDSLDSDFDELGLTFSKPVKGRVKFGSAAVDVLVFGGGYHGGWDPNDPTATSQIGKDINASDDSFGNAIYIVNARTGALIWKATQGSGAATNTNYQNAEMTDSIPSDVTVLETPAGLIHRVYVGDTGGSVWRVDLPPVNETLEEVGNDRASRWFVSRLAELAPSGEDIRFFHAPDIVEAEIKNDDGTSTPFDGVLIESGNRADPLDERSGLSAADNYLFYVRDYETISGADSVIPNTEDLTEPRYDADDLADRSCFDGTPCEVPKPAGWKVAFVIDGEKGLSSPLVDAGRVFATTYIPTVAIGEEGECGVSPEGYGRLYLLNLLDASAVGDAERIYDLGPGIPSGAVLIGDVIWLPSGGINADLDEDGTIDGVLTKSLTKRMVPIYWRQPGIDKL